MRHTERTTECFRTAGFPPPRIRMKLVRLSLILSSLLVLSACCSWEELRQFHAWPAKPVAAPQDRPAPAAQPMTPAPAPEPAVTAPMSAPAVATPVAPVMVETPAPAAEPALRATRSGAQVTLAWTLPVREDGYRAIEIMRNNSDSPKGRTRVKAVRSSVTRLDDTVESASERYWYWLKLTAPDNTVTNLGPVEAVETAR